MSLCFKNEYFNDIFFTSRLIYYQNASANNLALILNSLFIHL